MELRKLAEAFELALTEEFKENSLENTILEELKTFDLDIIDECNLKELATRLADRDNIFLPNEEFSVEDFYITEHGFDVLKNTVIALMNDEDHKEDMEYSQAEDNMIGYLDGLLAMEKGLIADAIRDDINAFEFSTKGLNKILKEI